MLNKMIQGQPINFKSDFIWQSVSEEAKDLDRIVKFVRISGFVNSNSDFIEQPKVINAASELLVEIFGDMAKHSRIAVGVASLPLNSTVEIDMVVEFST